MMQIALQNNGAMNLDKNFTGGGKGKNTQGASIDSLLPFASILNKMLNKSSQTPVAAKSFQGAMAGAATDNTADAAMDDQGRTAAILQKIQATVNKETGETPAGAALGNLLSLISLLNPGSDESGKEDLILEIDLQALQDAIQNGELGADNENIPGGADAGALASLVQSLMAAVNAQDDGLNAEPAASPLPTSQDIPVKDGARQGNKVFISVPQDLLKGFVVNKNGQPHFAPTGAPGTAEMPAISAMDETDAGNEGPVATDGDQNSPVPTLRLVRLNTQAAASSPQGALLAAVTAGQKTNPPDTVSAEPTTGDVEPEGLPPVDPTSQETLMKNTAERPVRDLLLNNQPTDAAAKAPIPAGGTPGAVKPGEQSAAASIEGFDNFNELLLHEEKGKSVTQIPGKEHTQWVPLAGTTALPLSAESGTVLKGVFIPMDRVVQEAASLIEKGAGKVQMTLHPPSLGAVNMEVVVQNNRLELVLTAQHADVQQLLQANSEQLKNALSNQGFQVDQLSVLLKREGFGFNLGGNFQWQGGAGQQPGNANGSVVTASMPETEVMLPRRDYETGAISIFA